MALIIAATALSLVLGMVLFRRVTYVDTKPALAVGENYFSLLQHNQMDEAFQLYTDGFLQKRGKDWQRVVAELDAKNGVVTSFKLDGAHIAPVVLRDGTDIPCVLARYQVKRTVVVSDEKLTICPHQRGDEWGIGGHEITRSDNGQHFEAGATFVEKGIGLGKY